MDRRDFLSHIATATVFPTALGERTEDGPITVDTIAKAEKLAGLDFTPAQREMMVEDLNENLDLYRALRETALPNDLEPALVFDPTMGGGLPRKDGPPMQWNPIPSQRPSGDDELAFMTVGELSHLLKSRQMTSQELTQLSLSRLRKFDPLLQVVVTLTEERALEKAAAADRELDAGVWRGPLHGIPYGAKDLLAVRGYRTTWGAMPFRNQVLDRDAAVVEKLDAAGAVLVAKLSLGALAWGDVWFGGMTKNPWNVEQGSSGSSAGPGSAVSAGLVPFAIGSETLGSIVSPSTRNGITGHRPTFGTVSRFGAMTLCWSMDKLGPMARSAEDCALVYDAVHGHDRRDPSTVDTSFSYEQRRDVRELRVAYYESAFDEEYDNKEADLASLDALRRIGFDLRSIELPNDLPVDAALLTLSVEAAAAFDDLTRSGASEQMVRQTRNAWPHVFRAARFVTAVEFLQANRVRTQLMRRMAEVFSDIDVLVTPTFGGRVLGITNLTGHPCVCVPNGFGTAAGGSERRRPGSISFIGGLYEDAAALEVAQAFQLATDFHRRRPPIK